MKQKATTGNAGYLLSIVFVSAIGGFLFGYDTAVINGTIEFLEKFFIEPFGWDPGKASAIKGFAISSALIGCIIGGLVAGTSARVLGRKRSMNIAALLFLVSAMGSAYPEMFFAGISTMGHHTFLSHFIFYRIVGGIGVGLASMVAPMYIAEIAPASKRGQLVSYQQLAIVTGILVSAIVNYLIGGRSGDEWNLNFGWRYMFGAEAIPAVLYFVLAMFIPESPRYLIMKNLEDRALDTLTKINGAEKAKEEQRSIKASLAQHVSGKLLSYGIGVIVVGMLLSAFQQFVGINVVFYYATEIFRQVGGDTNAALIQTVVINATNVIFTVIAIYTVDRWGRKPLQIMGALIMAVAMISLGFVFLFGSLGMAALICLVIYVAAFAMSWGPVVWVLLAEIFPNRIRGQAMGIAVAVQWLANFIVSQTFPMMADSETLNATFHGGFGYFIYGGFAVLAAWFMWKFVPETKGVPLEEMEDIASRMGKPVK